ncbi:YcfL family protein [Providencia sp. Me31A]|uniref:YcfL family protein n=1 Tax=Providencia sp. Me31A TaxID=3392637 RepID=UPI003D29D771
MKRIVLLGLMVMSVTGCLSQKPQGLVFNQRQSIIMEPSVLAQGVIVEKPVVNVENHRTVASVSMSNVQAEAVNIAYRLYWYDEQGLKIDTSGILQQTIPANSVVTVQGMTSSPRASHVRVHVFLSPKAGE